MMPYIYIIFIPMLIISISYYLENKPTQNRELVNFSFKMFKTFFTYALLLYYLGAENFVNTGLTFIPMLLFSIVLGIITIPFKIYMFLKK